MELLRKSQVSLFMWRNARLPHYNCGYTQSSRLQPSTISRLCPSYSLHVQLLDFLLKFTILGSVLKAHISSASTRGIDLPPRDLVYYS